MQSEYRQAQHGNTEPRDAQEQFRMAFEYAPIGMALVDLDGRFFRVNQALCELTGYTSDELSSRTFQDITHPDDIGQDMELYAALVRGELQYYHLEKRYIRPNGDHVWIRLRASIVRSETGEPLHCIAHILDITEDKRREQALKDFSTDLEKANASLGRSNVDLSEFAAVVAHDLKSPLQSFYLYVDRLAETPLDEHQSALTERLISATEWMNHLVDGVLEYCKADRAPKVTSVDCNVSARQALSNLEQELRSLQAAVTIDLLPTIQADEVQMEQLFQNLLSNSLKYAKSDTTPEINVKGESRADCWEFAVSDNGVGIPREKAERVFRMFARRREAEGAPGYGVGLATCKNILRRHGGDIWVDGSYSDGTRIRFRIPKVPPAA